MTTSTHPLAAEIAALTRDLTDFQAEVKMTRTAHSTTPLTRPALEPSSNATAPHTKAMASYLRRGDEEALRALDLKGMTTAVNAEGGYLVDPRTADSINHVLRDGSVLRRIAQVVQVEAGSYDVLIDRAELGAGWLAESSSASETAGPIIERVSIPLHELSAMPKASQRLLDDAAFDVEGWLASRIADRFARAENAAFINGDGNNKPSGFLMKPQVANASWSWGNIGVINSGAASGFATSNPTDPLIDLIYALGAEYRANAVFLMNSATAGVVRKFKDADGRYLWSDPTTADQPARLFGYPVHVAEDMPNVAAGATPIAFGDFRSGYTIVERPDLRVMRDPFSAKPHVLFYAARRVGGDVTDYAAIKLLKIAA